MRQDNYKIIGWREWISLPELNVPKIKVKIDTGAKSSSLHALDIHFTKEGQKEYVEFVVQTTKRSTKGMVECRCPLRELRKIKSSNGQTELRPVIQTLVTFMGDSWPIELNLTNRDDMGIPMLLGREGIQEFFLVDARNSFYGKRKKPFRKLKPKAFK